LSQLLKYFALLLDYVVNEAVESFCILKETSFHFERVFHFASVFGLLGVKHVLEVVHERLFVVLIMHDFVVVLEVPALLGLVDSLPFVEFLLAHVGGLPGFVVLHVHVAEHTLLDQLFAHAGLEGLALVEFGVLLVGFDLGQPVEFLLVFGFLLLRLELPHHFILHLELAFLLLLGVVLLFLFDQLLLVEHLLALSLLGLLELLALLGDLDFVVFDGLYEVVAHHALLLVLQLLL